jgi:hypothetical protein
MGIRNLQSARPLDFPPERLHGQATFAELQLVPDFIITQILGNHVGQCFKIETSIESKAITKSTGCQENYFKIEISRISKKLWKIHVGSGICGAGLRLRGIPLVNAIGRIVAMATA